MFKDKTRKELIIICVSQNARLEQLKITITKRNIVIRNYKIHLKKIKNKIDYLIEHPYAADTGNRTLRHNRDTPKGQKTKEVRK